MYTIKDIAKMASCSQSTVSKALNGRQDISKKTKQKILDIAARHNFVPNNSRKYNHNHRTENIGVVFCKESQPLSGNPFYSRVLEGIEGELVLNNYNLVLNLLPENAGNGIPKMIKERKIDGLIMIGIMTDDFIQQIKNIEIPVISVDPAYEHADLNKVTIDNERGAYVATKYLIDKGHKKIAFISGVLERSSFKYRFNGYAKAMKSFGLPIIKDYIKCSGVEKGYEQVSELLKLKERPTAIFSANDTNALYGYKAILDSGLNIPDDLSMVGFDDISMAKYASPPLTTVRVYKEEIGSVAVRKLLSFIDQKPDSRVHVLVPTRFVERDSVKSINI